MGHGGGCPDGEVGFGHHTDAPNRPQTGHGLPHLPYLGGAGGVPACLSRLVDEESMRVDLRSLARVEVNQLQGYKQRVT